MSPGVTGRIVWHLIFSHSGIHLVAFAEEYGAASVPACMPFHSAGYAVSPVMVVAVRSSVTAHACSAHTERLLAVIQHVSPAVTL